MPRLIAEGPALAVGPSGVVAVCAGGRLRLVDARTRDPLAERRLGEGVVELAFAEGGGVPRLLAFERGAHVTLVRSLALPRLEPSGELELTGSVGPAAVIGERVLVTSEAGEYPRLMTLAPRALSVDPIALREPVQLATATPEDRLLVAARDQVECWDPLLRRAMYRLNLPVSRPRQAGFAARRRLLWVASQAQLEAFRFSDGRLQLRVELGGRFVAAAGGGESPRVVVAIADGAPLPRDGSAGAVRGSSADAPRLEVLELIAQERRRIEAASTPAAFAVVDGEPAQLVLADAGGALTFLPLPTAEDPTAAEPVVTAAEGREARVEGGWRARVGARPEPKSAAPPPPPSPPFSAPIRDEEPRAPAPAGSPREAWRTQLLGWAEAAERAGAVEGLAGGEASLLREVARRFALEAPAAAALGLLYAAWLRGDDGGVPAATLQRLVAGAPTKGGAVEGAVSGDEDAAWREALGRGALGREQLVRAQRGRLRLRPAVGRFLDGAAPRIEIVASAAPLHSLPARLQGGPLRLALPDEEDRTAARTVARQLGQDVALVELGRRRPAAAQLLEARLYGALPLLCGDPAQLRHALDTLPHVLMLVGYRGYCPEALAALPVLELA